MRRAFLAVTIVVLVLSARHSRAQSAPPVSVSPASVTMLVGQTRPFRAVDGNGHALRNVDWSVFESEVVEVSSGDEVMVTAKRAGSATLRAHAGDGTADAHIEVVEGSALPQGTVIWGSGDIPGCRSTKITPAVPVANGPDIFEQSECPDGTYIRAYTSEGILLWRRKIGSKQSVTTPSTGSPDPQASANSLNTRAASICDSISLGMKKEAIGELLRTRNLAAVSKGKSTWLVEEGGADCKLWFGSNSELVKKRKTLIAE